MERGFETKTITTPVSRGTFFMLAKNSDYQQHYFVNFELSHSYIDVPIDTRPVIETFDPVSIKKRIEGKDSCFSSRKTVTTVEFQCKAKAIIFFHFVKKTWKPTISPTVSARGKYSYINIWRDREKVIQKKFHQKLGGKTEVRTPAGRIDLLTNDKIIEIKKVKDWKEAIGQIVVYGSFYRDHQKVVYLFDKEEYSSFHIIKSACASSDITVEFYLDEGWSYGDDEKF